MAKRIAGPSAACAQVRMSYDLISPLITHGQSLGPSYFWTTARRISSQLGHLVPTTWVGLLAVVIVSYAIILAIMFIQRRLRKRPHDAE